MNRFFFFFLSVRHSIKTSSSDFGCLVGSGSSSCAILLAPQDVYSQMHCVMGIVGLRSQRKLPSSLSIPATPIEASPARKALTYFNIQLIICVLCVLFIIWLFLLECKFHEVRDVVYPYVLFISTGPKPRMVPGTW